jgi:type 1 glutamine amidotransferase
MKANSLWSKLIVTFGCFSLAASAAEPKKILLVTVTTGFRHSGSIASAEKILPRLGTESGAFTIVDEAQQPPQKPNAPQKPKEPAADASEAAQAKYKADVAKYEVAQTKYQAELEKWNASPASKISPEQALKESLSKLSPDNLKKYDAVIFANTTGDLPLPDKQGFLDWIKNGGAFIGMHSASDTFRGHKPLDPYVQMLGGEFHHHDAQAKVEALNKDPQHPATRHLGEKFTVFDEIYLMNGYDPKGVHELLVLDKEPNSKAPGHYPIAWCKEFGKGKVFYTSLGHREDVWEPDWKDRKTNPKEVAEAYDKHILGGIKWALGLEQGDATPGN